MVRKYRPWSDRDIMLLRKLSATMTRKEIARAMGRPYSTVHKKLHDLGLTCRYDRNAGHRIPLPSPEEIARRAAEVRGERA